MNGEVPTPQTTLIILLGASEWPRWPDLEASTTFANSAQEVRNYFLDPLKFHLPPENLLDLFDSDQDADDIDDAINQFLHTRIMKMNTSSQAARDVLVYFIGHADFVGDGLDYYLAIRRTRKSNPEISGLRMASLAKTTKENTRHLRLMLILDCCYAASAFNAFHTQGVGLEEMVKRKTFDNFKGSSLHTGNTHHIGWPKKGISLLCSSSRSKPSLLGDQYTEFSGALLSILDIGSADEPENMSLRVVANLVQKFLDEMGSEAPRPEVHSPDQSTADVAMVPFFPNPQASETLQYSRSAHVAKTSHIPDMQKKPSAVVLPLSRQLQNIFAILLCLMLLIVVSSRGIWLFAMQQGKLHTSLATVTAIAASSATTTTAISPLPMATAAASVLTSTSKGTQFGFDAAHTSWNRYEQIINASNVTRLALLWSYQMGGFPQSAPAVAGGMVYVGSWDGKFYAFDATCRKACQPLWSYQTGSAVQSSPAVADDVVYVGSTDGKLYAFDATCRKACQPLWSYQMGSIGLSSPAVAGGMAYIGSRDGKLYAFDATCRKACQPLWSYQTNLVKFPGIDSSPAIADGMVYIGSNDNNFYAFDATCRKACQPLWSYQTGGVVYSSPAVAGGVMYIGSEDDMLYAFATTCRSLCQPLWSYQTSGAIFSPPAVANGMVYVGSYGSADRYFYAFDASCRSNCQPLWSYRTSSGQGWDSSMIANGVVYVDSMDGKLYTFDATCRSACQPLYYYQMQSMIGLSPPTIANGVIYVGSDDHKLYAFGLSA